jgi:hypothetical protein
VEKGYKKEPMKPAEKPPTFKLLKPEAQPVYSCPKCGRTMTKGVVRVWQEIVRGRNDLGEVIVATVGTVFSKAGASITGSEPQLEFVPPGQEPLRVVRSGCVQTSYRCDCGVVTIFPVVLDAVAGEACDTRPDFDPGVEDVG